MSFEGRIGLVAPVLIPKQVPVSPAPDPSGEITGYIAVIWLISRTYQFSPVSGSPFFELIKNF
jgi:hypothetical protein